jgi:hypothetical protein
MPLTQLIEDYKSVLATIEATIPNADYHNTEILTSKAALLHDIITDLESLPSTGVTEEKSLEAWRAEGLPLLMAMVRTGYSQAAIDISQFCIDNDVPEVLSDKVISMLNSENKREFVYDLFKKELQAADLLPSPPVLPSVEEGDKMHYEALQECCNRFLDSLDNGKLPSRQIAGLRILLNRPSKK